MGIVAEDLERVRAETDLVALVGEHTQIKRSGRQWMAVCPMHGERTASLSISAEKGVYHCFGCGRGGDSISFYREVTGADFVVAVEALAARAHIELRYTSTDEGRARSRRRRLADAVAEAVKFYRKMLVACDDTHVRRLAESLGFDGAADSLWQPGWAPPQTPIGDIVELGRGDLDAAGLTDAGRDAFSGCVVVAIVDESGAAVGLAGASAADERWRMPPQRSALYKSDRVLFGLHQQRAEIVKLCRAAVFDSVAGAVGHRGGGESVVLAAPGDISETHCKLLRRFAAQQVTLMAVPAEDQARRLFGWAHDNALSLLTPAPHGDVPLLRRMVDCAVSGHDLSTGAGRDAATAAARHVVAAHPDPLVRREYLAGVERLCVSPEPAAAGLVEAERVLLSHAAADPSAVWLLQPGLFHDAALAAAAAAAVNGADSLAGLLLEAGITPTADSAAARAAASDMALAAARCSVDELLRQAAADPVSAASCAVALRWLKTNMEKLDTVGAEREAAVAVLLPWLAEHAATSTLS